MFEAFSQSDKNARILVVDDAALSRAHTTKLLQGLGFRYVTTAEDGQAAWELLSAARDKNEAFTLVLSDWMMPRLDGIGLLEKIKASGWDLRPHLVLITSESDKGNLVSAIKAGISSYIRKPLKEDALIEALKNVESQGAKAA
jgi:two-component system, chemotaxis family, chemotaxis protein CheY